MSDARLIDGKARERIRTRLDRNLLVEAGAGSGKTQMMAERMAAGIASGVYVVEHMAAVTFTRKAAAELRGRFQLALEAELKAAAKDAARAERVRKALAGIERFFAGTIHSFCAHLLRERPVEAGVSPGFTELDEVEDARLRRQSWRDFRSQLKASGDARMIALIDAGVKPSDLDRAFDTMCLFEEVDFPGGDGRAPDTAAARAGLDAFWKALQKLLPKTIAPNTTCKTQQRARTFRRLLNVTRALDRPRALYQLLEVWDNTPAVVQMRWSDDPKEKKRLSDAAMALHATFRADVVEPFATAWRQHLYGLSVELLTRAREQAREDRRRLNTLNYGDLLHLAARVLRQNAEVRRALGDKYRWVFVDEFQDTDPVQAEIMCLLAADGGVEATRGGRQKGAGRDHKATAGEGQAVASTDADWRTVTLRPGALFVVGDPKQSIFRFRRADIDIYNEVRARLEGSSGGELLHLTSNFRSAGSLCEWANDVFATQFPVAATTQSPMFARLDAARTSVGEPSGLFTLTTPASVNSAEIAGHEADAIARYIVSEVRAGRRRHGDFLILTRKKKDLDVYAGALEALLVPVEVSGAGAFGDSIEVRQLALLLRALADPQDGVALVGVLRGGLFGLSDRDLFAYRQAGGTFTFFAPSPDSKAEPVQRVADALASLRQMHRWTQVIPAGAAVERILEHTGYLALAATTPGGVEAGDLLHAVDRIRSIVEDGFTLADAAEALEPDAEEPSDIESLPLEPGQDDVVRVMNLHKAKGLEAPVVFLADPLSGVKERVDARIIRDGATARGYFLITKKVGEHGRATVAEPPGWAQHEADELEYVRAEEKRLLYVAATRAKDMLVVGRSAKAGGGPWAAFDASLAKAPELKIPPAVDVPLPQPVDLSPAAAAGAGARAAARHAEAMRASWTSASVTGEKHILPRTASIEALPDDPSRVVTADTPSRRADAGTAWGSLVHGLLEHAMRHQGATRDDLRRLALWLTLEAPDLRPVIDEAVATVQAVARREFWAEAQEASERHEEVPFAVAVSGDAGGAADASVRHTVLHGTIDSVFRRAEGWKVVDYKTDADATPAVLQARYGEQLAAYASAWQRFTGSDVASALVDARDASVKVKDA